MDDHEGERDDLAGLVEEKDKRQEGRRDDGEHVDQSCVDVDHQQEDLVGEEEERVIPEGLQVEALDQLALVDQEREEEAGEVGGNVGRRAHVDQTDELVDLDGDGVRDEDAQRRLVQVCVVEDFGGRREAEEESESDAGSRSAAGEPDHQESEEEELQVN